jgi:hypothetical protein
VVTVGATHRTGKTYLWKDGHRPGQAPLAKPPTWLLEYPNPPATTTGKGYASAALASEEQQLLQTPPGQRNHRLNLAAFRLARFIATQALDQADIEDVLFDAAKRLGLTDREARATIASGLRAGTSTHTS